MFKELNLNPKGKNTSDCIIRALAYCLDISWEDSYTLLYQKGLELKEPMLVTKVMDSVLKDHSWEPHKPLRHSDDNRLYTIEETSKEVDKALINVRNSHVSCIDNGYIVDTWNCSHQRSGVFWTPPKE